MPIPNVVQSTTMTLQNLLLLGLSVWPVRRPRPSIGRPGSRSFLDDDGAIQENGEELTASLSVLGSQLPVRFQVCDHRGLNDDAIA
jgi:hypothetical protein